MSSGTGNLPPGIVARGDRPRVIRQQAFRAGRHAAYALRRLAKVGLGWPRTVYLGAAVRVTGGGVVRLGPEVRLNERVWLHAESDGVLTIGAGSAIGRDSMITCAGSVEIGRDVLFGPNVLVCDNSHGSPRIDVPYILQPVRVNAPITIEDGVWIGMGARVISSRQPVTVGRGAIIGANAIVRASVPARTIVAAGTVFGTSTAESSS